MDNLYFTTGLLCFYFLCNDEIVDKIFFTFTLAIDVEYNAIRCNAWITVDIDVLCFLHTELPIISLTAFFLWDGKWRRTLIHADVVTNNNKVTVRCSIKI